MEKLIKNWQADPWDTTTDTVTSMVIQSPHYGGSFEAITVESSANYPDSLGGTPSRYFVNVPQSIDVSALGGSKPIAIYDNNSSATLTRVTAAPGANEYRVPPAASERNNVIEFNSGQAGHVIEFDFFGMGSIMGDEDALYMRNQMEDVKELSASYSITSTDGFTRFISSPNNTMIPLTLPALSESQGRRVPVSNATDGVTKVIRAGSDTINDGVNDATEVYLHSRGDNLVLLATSTEWIIEKIRDTILTGWVGRSDWTGVNIGAVNITIDNGSSGTLGFEVGEGVSSSDSGGRIIDITDNADGTGTLIVYQCTGGGNFSNNFSITGNNSSASALVNGATKNVNTELYHGLTLNKRDLYVEPLYSTDGTDTNASEMPKYADDSGVNLGAGIWQIDTDSIRHITASDGFRSVAKTGGSGTLTGQDYFYNTKISRNI